MTDSLERFLKLLPAVKIFSSPLVRYTFHSHDYDLPYDPLPGQTVGCQVQIPGAAPFISLENMLAVMCIQYRVTLMRLHTIGRRQIDMNIPAVMQYLRVYLVQLSNRGWHKITPFILSLIV
ncbi:hypothetical protein D3C76_1544700 [compost metagenome]